MTQAYLPGVEGAELRRDLSQFYTPAWLADALWQWAKRGGDVSSVVEPSAGRGALVRSVLFDGSAKHVKIAACEADPENVLALRSLETGAYLRMRVFSGDFMTLEPQHADLALQNTPFENGQDIAFVERSLLWAPRVVGIFPANMFYSAGRAAFWQRVCPRRIAFLCSRPRFGGEHQPMTDFTVQELVAGDGPLATGTPTVEWWT